VQTTRHPSAEAADQITRRRAVAQTLTDAPLERGLLTRVAMNCICLAPPLVTSDALLDRIVDTVHEAIPPALDAARKELPLPVRS
jgi:adenosylmethionine-8-amino-7-oxononanoate aminotransferase